ncbi:MAG TPA: O-antigen ligase family protein [Thermoleophilaceae bacterium]|nr:O-antigen ligase family protein [Thermoleophilaceae bacterium]
MPAIRTLLGEHRDAAVLAAAAAAAVLLGLLLARSPLLAGLAVLALAVAAGAARFGALAVVAPAIAALPWLVVLEGIAPPLLGTFTTAAATAGLLLVAMPLRFDGPLVPFGALGFVLIVLAHATFATDEEQLIQASKYMIFPAVALAVASLSTSDLLVRLKWLVLGSSLGAMVFHLGIVAAGVGNSSTYYDAGEKLGLSAEGGPHSLALLATIVAAAGLTLRRADLQIAFFALGAVPALLTGVRSAMLAIAVILVVYLVQSRGKPRALGVLAGIAAIAVVSGAVEVVIARFDSESAELASFASLGSGRGIIWTVALQGWEAAGPGAWLYGAGLRSVFGFEVAALGSGFVGHSDFIEVIVQLGVAGLVAWVALWGGLLRAGLSALVLLPMLAFGVVNGTLEYVPPLAVGLFLAAAVADRRRSPP